MHISETQKIILVLVAIVLAYIAWKNLVSHERSQNSNIIFNHLVDHLQDRQIQNLYEMSSNGLDTSFARNGVTTIAIPGQNFGGLLSYYGEQSVAFQKSKGRLIIAGTTEKPYPAPIAGRSFAVCALKLDGTQDTTFGTNGFVIPPNIGAAAPTALLDGTLNSVHPTCVKIDSNNKVVVCGLFQNTASLVSSWVARFNEDGSLDTTFNTTGWVQIALDATLLLAKPAGDTNFERSTPVLFASSTRNAFIWNAEIQSDNKIVLNGFAVAVAPTIRRMLVIRVNTDGKFDTDFGKTIVGSTTYLGTGCVEIMCGNPDSSNIVAGTLLKGREYRIVSGSGFAALGSVNDATEGTPFTANVDATNPGTVTWAYLSSESYTCKIQADGKMVIAGFSKSNDSFLSKDKRTVCMCRLTSSGILDTSFVGDSDRVSVSQQSGILIYRIPKWQLPTEFDDTGFSVCLDSKQNIIIGGISGVPGHATPAENVSFAISRFDKDGKMDKTFNTTGTLIVDASGVGLEDTCYSCVCDEKDNVVAVGRSKESTISGLHKPTVVKVDPNGNVQRVSHYGDIFPTESQAFDIVNCEAGMFVLGTTLSTQTGFKESFLMKLGSSL